MNLCNRCKKVQESTAFYKQKDKNGNIVLVTPCKECRKKYAQNQRDSRPKLPPKPKRPRKQGFRLLPEGKRKCSSCKEIKSVEFFYKDSKRASGTQPRCKSCQNNFLKRRRKERGTELLEKRRAWKEENQERLREQNRLHQQAYRSRKRIVESNRRARKKSLTDTLTTEETEELLLQFNKRCSICNNPFEELDHFIPLNTGYGGTFLGNIIPLCKFHNSSKGAKNPFVWAESLSKYERERFDCLVDYLTVINGIATAEDYKAHVNLCFK